MEDPANSRVALITDTVGDIVSYICNPGFELMGAQTLTCQSDGTWSDPPPTYQTMGVKSPLY